jgi:Putative transposase/Transposase zinc-binding domain
VLEVADILREAGPAYRESFASRMPRSHLQAMRAIENCRTAALGGHVLACDQCHVKQYTYHSCRNRHCPKCQGQEGQRWLDAQRARLLPVPYFLLTFTLPAELRSVARSNPKLVYGILMTAAAEALLELASNPRYLGARPGMISVLHTWTRAMTFHPHAHLLVTAGGLSPDGERWLAPKNPKFLVPGYALGVLFRAKVRDALKKAQLFEEVPSSAWAKNKKWVVHVKHAGTGTKVLEYLARYVFRIAITNSRLVRFENSQVTFRHRDNRSGEIKHCTLPAADFIARFLQHVLPRGFTKVRHYGVYSPTRKHDLERSRALIGATQHEPADSRESLPASAPSMPDEKPCPYCKVGRLHVVETIPRLASRGPP